MPAPKLTAEEITARIKRELRDAAIGAQGVRPFTGEVTLRQKPYDETAWEALVGTDPQRMASAAEVDVFFFDLPGGADHGAETKALEILRAIIPTTPKFDPCKLTVILEP